MPRISDYPDSTGLKDTDKFVVDDMTEDQTLSYTGAMLKEYVNDNRTSSVAAFEEVDIERDFVMLQNEDTGAHSRISVSDFKEVVNDIRTSSIMAFSESIKTENEVYIDAQNGNTGSHSKISMADMDQYIKGLIAGLYRFRGSVEIASLPPVSTAEEGDVYNIKSDFMTTSDFIEGPGASYSAGSNVVMTDQNKWDVMGGLTVDLSDYATNNYVTEHIASAKTAIEEYVNTQDNTLKTSIEGIIFKTGLTNKTYNINNPINNFVFMTASSDFIWSDDYPKSFKVGSRMIVCTVTNNQAKLIADADDDEPAYQFAVVNDHILASRSRVQNKNGFYSWEAWTESKDDMNSLDGLIDSFKDLIHNGKAIKDPNLPESILSTINCWDNTVVFDHCPPRAQGNFMFLLTIPLSGQTLKNAFCLQFAFYGDAVIKKSTAPYIAYRCTKNAATNEWEDWIMVKSANDYVGEIATLTNFNQITSVGKWRVSNIDNTYATSIGILNNVQDWYVDCLNYNGGKFCNFILTSPRLANDFYMVQSWDGTATARFIPGNEFYTSGLFTDRMANNQVGVTISYNDLMKGGKGVKAFTNWNDSTHFPLLYGCGFVFDCADATYRYIFYTGVSKTWYGIVHNPQNVDPWPNPQWKKLIDSDQIPFSFGVDANGNYGYYKQGADTVTPFKSGLPSFKYPRMYMSDYNLGTVNRSTISLNANSQAAFITNANLSSYEEFGTIHTDGGYKRILPSMPSEKLRSYVESNFSGEGLSKRYFGSNNNNAMEFVGVSDTYPSMDIIHGIVVVCDNSSNGSISNYFI